MLTGEGSRARRSAYSPKLSKIHQLSSPSRSNGGTGRDFMRTGERLMPQLPTTTVVTPCDILHSMHSGPHSTARSSCVCASMKPGATALPVATISRSPVEALRSPTATMRSPVTPISAWKRGLPVPSKTVASRMIRSQRMELAPRFCDIDVVERLGVGGGDQSVTHVPDHGRGIAGGGVAHARAAG